ncbi:MAG: hypothetical protein ACTHMO_09760 [Rhodanobacteraceae bacterium]
MLRVVAIGFALTFAMLLDACAHAPLTASAPPPSRDDAIKQLQADAPCCKNWSELPFHHALPREPHDYAFEASSPVAELDGQPTHFLAFVLPAWREPYRVLFRARPSARHLGSSYLFAPTATLLDAKFQPLRSEDVKLCEYIGWRPGLSGAFGSFTVDDARAKYLVITTSAAQLKDSTYWEQSPAGFTSDVSAPPSSSGSFAIPHGPDGELTVGELTHSYRSAVDNAICAKPKQGTLLK